MPRNAPPRWTWDTADAPALLGGWALAILRIRACLAGALPFFATLDLKWCGSSYRWSSLHYKECDIVGKGFLFLYGEHLSENVGIGKNSG